ncbi:structural maintenance of chromosomes protein 2 [Trichonephila clavipes]|nr:structural maintenance of chromosomes protein 2 [Trichonephila clavipes]
MTPTHQHLCLEWCRAQGNWTAIEWNQVPLSNESRFNFSSDDNRVHVWRPCGERLNPAFALQQHTATTAGVMVITGGKTKYLINGVSANNNRVHDLFQSVQLNVNNPHFLIMQGRITKVLNMKPLEILSMIEEAAGTRMYEEKKETALKNLEKKDSKLREINAMLEEHINPQLEKLKEDRKEYTKYTKVVREYEHLYKIYIAWDYCQTEELVKKSGVEKETIKNNYEDQKKLIADLKKQLVKADVRIQEIEKKIDEDCGNKLKEIETELKSQQVTEAKFDTQLKNLKDALNEEKKKQADLIKNLKENLPELEMALSDLKAKRKGLRQAFTLNLKEIESELIKEIVDRKELSILTQIPDKSSRDWTTANYYYRRNN